MVVHHVIRKSVCKSETSAILLGWMDSFESEVPLVIQVYLVL